MDDLISGLAELACSWRFYLCFGIAAGVIAAVHLTFPNQAWVYFISVPTGIAGFILGFYWESKKC
ncbi:MAG: hypothetical protein EOP88_21220 [Verrucomicrobiaceae bacterium]|nr:MAG: hypothetical protein EOP88_21220 [Verrucomicrobiaceae bacterium]